LFAFHANANPNTQFLDATAGAPLASNLVMAFPKSVGMGWAIGVDAPRFDRVYAELLANHCIDANSVFAMVHSLGATFTARAHSSSSNSCVRVKRAFAPWRPRRVPPAV